MSVQKINSKVIDGSMFFQNAQVDGLHEKLSGREIYPRDELSETTAAVNLINVQALSPAAKETFQSLCGRLHKLNTNIMVDTIVDKAQSLKKNGISNPKDIEFLRKAIAEIWEGNTLSEVNSNLLRVASITLAQLASGKRSDVVNPSDVNIAEENEVLPESTVKGTDISTNREEVELAFELLELSDLFYQGKIREGLERVKTLPRRLELPPISEASSADEIATFIQEAVALSFKIGRSDGYAPSALEIQELLEEAASLS